MVVMEKWLRQFEKKYSRYLKTHSKENCVFNMNSGHSSDDGGHV